MRKIHVHIIFTVVLVVISMASILQAQQGRGTGRIRGTVKDEAGSPIKGVKIIAEHQSFKIAFESTSDKKGNWAVGGLGTGNFRITASKDGYEPVYHEMKVSQFSEKNTPVEFTMQRILEVPKDTLAIQDEAALAMYEKGNQLFVEKNFEEAVTLFKEFLEKNPTFYQVNINIGRCYMELNDYNNAIASFQLVLDKIQEEKGSFEGEENAVNALASMGETYMKKGEFDQARKILKQAIEIFPEEETLAFKIGEIYFKQGDTEHGIEYYKISTQIREDWGPPHRQLGYAYLNKGEYQLALESFKKFLQVDPDSSQAPTIKALIPTLEGLIKK